MDETNWKKILNSPILNKLEKTVINNKREQQTLQISRCLSHIIGMSRCNRRSGEGGRLQILPIQAEAMSELTWNLATPTSLG